MDPATEPFGQVEVKAGDAATASKTKPNFRIAVTTVRDKPEPLGASRRFAGHVGGESGTLPRRGQRLSSRVPHYVNDERVVVVAESLRPRDGSVSMNHHLAQHR